MSTLRLKFILAFFFIAIAYLSFAQRIPVLNQIDLPHNYYFRELYLPQLTSAPSSLAWMPDNKSLIYSMAGSEEQNPAMSTEELVTLIKQVKRSPVERDTLYNVVKDYSDVKEFDVTLN